MNRGIGQLVCGSCGATYSSDEPRWKCDCAGVLDLEFEARFPVEAIGGRKPTMWRYREALPIGDDAQIVSFDEGFTPLLDIAVAGRGLSVKLEQLFTTGSYKDRGASVLISKVNELGVRRIVEDSSGNAGCAIAGYAARAGIACDIYVPSGTSPGKLAQIRMFGARLHAVPGSRQDTADAALAAAGSSYYASHSWNPFFAHGTKTYAFEIWEQLDRRAPDTLLFPTGNGTLLIGAYLGFRDLLRQGLVATLPKFVAIQSSHCAPLYRMFREGLDDLPATEAGKTIAEGIAVAKPVRGKQIVDIVRETAGEVLIVTDGEVERALIELCGQGLYVEPSAAVSVAGFKQYRGAPGERVVAPLTGHGLKSTEKFLELANDRPGHAVG